MNPVPIVQSRSEQEAELGLDLRKLRLNKGLSQQLVADRAGVDVKAIRRLESGAGSTVGTLIAVLGVLGRKSWLQTIAPVASINPLNMPVRGHERQRARARVTRGGRSQGDG